MSKIEAKDLEQAQQLDAAEQSKVVGGMGSIGKKQGGEAHSKGGNFNTGAQGHGKIDMQGGQGTGGGAATGGHGGHADAHGGSGGSRGGGWFGFKGKGGAGGAGGHAQADGGMAATGGIGGSGGSTGSAVGAMGGAVTDNVSDTISVPINVDL